MRSSRAPSSRTKARSCTARRRRRWRSHEHRSDRRAVRVHPRDLRRVRGHLEGPVDAAHAAHVRCKRDPRDHRHRRDARVGGHRWPSRPGARILRGRARRGQRRRWIRRDRPDAGDVQAEARSEAGAADVVDLHALIPLTYLIAAVTFVLGLKGLSGPKTAVNGNRIAAAGMLLAVAATFFDIEFQSYGVTGLVVTAAGLLVGGSAGFYGARVVKMTAMPQMIALF